MLLCAYVVQEIIKLEKKYEFRENNKNRFGY